METETIKTADYGCRPKSAGLGCDLGQTLAMCDVQRL